MALSVTLLLVFGVIGQQPPKAQAAPSDTINFQARLLTGSGAEVPDGDYNLEFKLYDAETSGTLLWTETWSATKVQVKNGHLSVGLGSLTAFPGTINWEDELWLTMNVGGVGTPVWDGEMNPRMQFTSVPYAFRAGSLGMSDGTYRTSLDFATLTADRSIVLPDESGTVCLQGSAGCNFVQLAPLSIQTVNSAGGAIQLNQTGAGDLLILQTGGTDRFRVANNGNVTAAGALDINGASVDIGTSTVAGSLIFNDGSSNTLRLQPGALSSNLTFTLPTNYGTAGQCLTGDGAGTLSFGSCAGPGGYGTGITVVKAANEIQNNVLNGTATLQPDDHLFFPVGASQTWSFRFVVQANSATVPDLKFSVIAPTGATCSIGVLDAEGAATVGNLGCGVSSGLIAGNNLADTYEIVGTVRTAATAGTVRLQWAQNTANAATSTVFAGSYVNANSTTSTGNAIFQDGNSLGADVVVGSNDAFNFSIETSGTTRMTIDSAGDIVALGDQDIRGSLIVGDTATDRLTINGQITGANPLVFQGASDDLFTTTFNITDPLANQTITFPDASGIVCLDSGNCTAAGTAGGDLSGTYPNPTVSRINGATLGTTTASSGNILVADGSMWSSVVLSGDATISSAGVVTIAANSVALGTDTTGDYITAVANGSGISVGGSGGETATATISLGALTADWVQTGAFDISLNNASSELKIMESAGGTFYGILDSGDLTADRTITIPDASGVICLDTGNYTAAGTAGGDLSGTYPNATVSRINGATLGATTASSGNILVADGSMWSSVALSGDATISSTGAVTIAADSVALGTDTTGDYITAVANGSGISVGGSGGENATATLSLGALTTDWAQTGAFDISLNNASSELKIMESVGGTYFGILDSGNLTADRTIVIPDASGVICLDTGNCTAAGTAGGDLSGTYPNATVSRINGATLGATTASSGNILVADGSMWSSVAVSGDASIGSGGALTINGNSVALGGDTVGDFIAAISSGSGVSVSGSGGENATATLSLGALTTDWTQSGAFDVSLGNAGSELKIMESVGGAFYGIIDTGDLSADRTFVLPDEAGTVCIRSSANCGYVQLAPGVKQGDASTSSSIYINKTGASGNILSLEKNGAGVFTILNDGSTQINTTSTAALVIDNASGTDFFTVDTSGNIVRVGAAAADATAVLMVLDTKTTTGDPTGVNGGSYYNSADATTRCFENGFWADCSTTRVLGQTTLGAAAGTISVTLADQTEYIRCRLDAKGRSLNGFVYMRFNSDATGNAYGWNEYSIVNTVSVDSQDSSDSEIQLNGGGTTSNTPISSTIDITNFLDTRKIVDWTASTVPAPGTNMQRFSGSGTWNEVATQITSVQFLTSTGTFNTGSHAWCEGRDIR